jgi:hypothetical protein
MDHIAERMIGQHPQQDRMPTSSNTVPRKAAPRLLSKLPRPAFIAGALKADI